MAWISYLIDNVIPIGAATAGLSWATLVLYELRSIERSLDRIEKLLIDVAVRLAEHE